MRLRVESFFSSSVENIPKKKPVVYGANIDKHQLGSEGLILSHLWPGLSGNWHLQSN